MEKNKAGAALIATLSNSVQALGRGFDVTADTRLLYCKGTAGSRLVEIDEEKTRDFDASGGGIVLKDVPVGVDVEISKERGARESTSVCSFRAMAEYFNKKSGLSETVPLGSFNSMFSLTGSWKIDAAATKALAMDGYFIPLFKVKLKEPELVLRGDVKRAVPRSWDPPSLASFIENFGTHIVTSVTIGGRDEVYIKQHHSSLVSALDVEKYVKEIGDQRFSDLEKRFADTLLLNHRDGCPQQSSVPHLSGKEDVAVIFRRRGGDDLVQSHAEWADTVPLAPDVINMTFIPIVSLLEGLPGIQYLARAVDLYLDYKPPIEELQYFLEFQVQRVWAPAQTILPGHQRKEPICPFLQFSMMGPKLYISSEQIKEREIGLWQIVEAQLSLSNQLIEIYVRIIPCPVQRRFSQPEASSSAMPFEEVQAATWSVSNL